MRQKNAVVTGEDSQGRGSCNVLTTSVVHAVMDIVEKDGQGGFNRYELMLARM
jgi:hypothetical protein